jgi:hypothetical protein
MTGNAVQDGLQRYAGWEALNSFCEELHIEIVHCGVLPACMFNLDLGVSNLLPARRLMVVQTLETAAFTDSEWWGRTHSQEDLDLYLHMGNVRKNCEFPDIVYLAFVNFAKADSTQPELIELRSAPDQLMVNANEWRSLVALLCPLLWMISKRKQGNPPPYFSCLRASCQSQARGLTSRGVQMANL